MGQSADELRREIEGTRGDLGETLDAIGDRVSPGRMLERRKNRFVNGVQSVRDRVMGTAESTSSAVADSASGAVEGLKQAPDAVRQRTEGSPIGAGAIAFGLGFLAAAAFPASRMEREAADQLMDKAQPLKDELVNAGKEVAENLKEPALSAVQDVKATATAGSQEVAATAKDATTTTTDTAREATSGNQVESAEGPASR